MKKLTLLITLACIIQATATSQPCLPEGITFTTQAQIDNFPINYPGCTKIEGDTRIQGDDITNLDSLSNLTSILGYLKVNSNPLLKNLNGLDNLVSIGEELQIENNGSLISLSGLDNLETIGGKLRIQSNPTLIDITNLVNLDANSIQDISIYSNSSLSNCEANSICGYLANPIGTVGIYNNAPGCNNPGEIAADCGFDLPCLPFGNYWFTSQSEIDNFQQNYPGCDSLNGTIYISGENITNLYGLNALTSVNGGLSIMLNDSLTTLTGLENLTTIDGGLTIGIWGFGNPSLQNLNGLNNLSHIGGDLDIHANPLLTSLDGLEKLTYIGGDFALGNCWAKTNVPENTRDGNSSLKNFEGLENLEKIAGSLSMHCNNSLISLKGLENLSSIGEGISIEHNRSLTNLNAISNIDPESIQSLYIRSNRSLSRCDIESICAYLANPNGDIIAIAKNAYGCNSIAEVERSCAGEPCPFEKLVFRYQPQIDSFQTFFPDCKAVPVDMEIGNEYLTTSINNLDGLAGLQSIEGSVTILNNDSLIILTGLDSIASIGGDLVIGGWGIGNTALNNLAGLSGLTSVGGSLIIDENILLTNLTGLENLNSISGNLIIMRNSSLLSLEGLDNLEAGSINDLHIVYNDLLDSCNILPICSYLVSPNGDLWIHTNAPGCNSKAEVDTACKYSFVGEISILDKLLIHPNPFTTSTTIEYELQQSSTVQIIIYNHLGKQLEVIQQKKLAGKQQVLWNAEGLPSGVYFCMIKTESGMQTLKMIKMR